MINRRTKSHTRRSAEEWQRLVGLQRDSGQSQAAFCKTKGLGLSTFRYWKKRLRGDAGLAASAPSWLELPPVVKPLPENGWDIELELGDGLRLRLSRR